MQETLHGEEPRSSWQPWRFHYTRRESSRRREIRSTKSTAHGHHSRGPSRIQDPSRALRLQVHLVNTSLYQNSGGWSCTPTLCPGLVLSCHIGLALLVLPAILQAQAESQLCPLQGGQNYRKTAPARTADHGSTPSCSTHCSVSTDVWPLCLQLPAREGCEDCTPCLK